MEEMGATTLGFSPLIAALAFGAGVMLLAVSAILLWLMLRQGRLLAEQQNRMVALMQRSEAVARELAEMVRLARTPRESAPAPEVMPAPEAVAAPVAEPVAQPEPAPEPEPADTPAEAPIEAPAAPKPAPASEPASEPAAEDFATRRAARIDRAIALAQAGTSAQQIAAELGIGADEAALIVQFHSPAG